MIVGFSDLGYFIFGLEFFVRFECFLREGYDGFFFSSDFIAGFLLSVCGCWFLGEVF